MPTLGKCLEKENVFISNLCVAKRKVRCMHYIMGLESVLRRHYRNKEYET